MTWPAWFLLLGIAAAPLLPLAYVSGRLLAHARSLWLLGVLTGGIVWVAPHALWLALIGLWFLIRWPREPDPTKFLPAVLRWLGVAGAWGLLLAIPKELLAYAPWGWLLVAWGQSLAVLSRRLRWGGRQKGEMGSPVLTALYLALVSPFCPWWGWPILGVGLGLIFSFHALVAAGLGLVWLYPRTWPLGALAALAGAILWGWSPVVGGRRILEWTPRGDTFDSIVSRWRGWQLMWHYGRDKWLLGRGPGSMEPTLLKWGSRYDLELTWGEGFNELLHFYYEYGLLGVAAVVAFCWPILQRLTVGDPWSAAWGVGIVLAMGHWPARHVSMAVPWLAISAYLVRS